jgi:hypothetical protein
MTLPLTRQKIPHVTTDWANFCVMAQRSFSVAWSIVCEFAANVEDSQSMVPPVLALQLNSDGTVAGSPAVNENWSMSQNWPAVGA